MNKISIIIPVLNEVGFIHQLLQHLIQTSNPSNIAEIIVVDGGSIDGTLKLMDQFITSSNLKPNSGFANQPNIMLLRSEKGRAKQMNLGAKKATGDIFYFLHADSFPPKGFDQLIINNVENNHLAGCFRMQFNSTHWWLRLASWLTQFHWRACRGGDQSQFITKKLFEAIGGYDENYIIYEDNILINELYKRKQFLVINKKIRTSARLYKKLGIWKVQYHFWTIYVKRWFGATADELYTYYKRYLK